MIHGAKLMMQSPMTIDEMSIAVDMFDWFVEESFSGKHYYSNKEKKWVIDKSIPLPSWKHLTKGGHGTGHQLQRGSFGVPCSRFGKQKGVDNLVLRRHNTTSNRVLVIQRIEDLIVPVGIKTDKCTCKSCIGNVKFSSKLSYENLILYKEI